MFWKITGKRVSEANALFTGHFVEVKAVYAVYFNQIPSVGFIGELDVTKAFAHIKKNLGKEIVTIHQHAFFDHGEQRMLFNNTIFVLRDQRMIELANDYCQILHAQRHHGWASGFLRDLAAFRIIQAVKEKRIIGFARQTELS